MVHVRKNVFSTTASAFTLSLDPLLFTTNHFRLFCIAKRTAILIDMLVLPSLVRFLLHVYLVLVDLESRGHEDRLLPVKK